MANITLVNIADVIADDEFNCRGHIDPLSVVDLAKDIQEHGLIQPIVITPSDTEGKYNLIAGYRRHLAHKLNKAVTIEAIIRERMPMDEALVLNLNENIQRTDLTVYQEAYALKKLMDLGMTEPAIARKLNKSRGWVQVRCLLLKLPEEVQQEAEEGKLTQAQIRELYSVYIKEGVEATYKAAHDLKEYVQNQRTPTVGSVTKRSEARKPKPSNVKTQRNKGDIIRLLEHLGETVGMGLHSRCLAWAIGEITTAELISSIKEYAEDNGMSYVAPDVI